MSAEDDDYGGELTIVHEQNGDVTMTHHADFGGDDEDLDQYADFGVNLKLLALRVGPPAATDAPPPAMHRSWLWHLFHPGHKDA